MSGTTAPAGWYADPYQPGLLRWFDGLTWTDHVAAATPLPPTAATVVAHPGRAMPVRPPASDGGLHWILPVGRTGLSIAAGYVGLVAMLCFYLAPVSLVLGLLALRELRDPALRGRGRAWFATVVGAIGSAILAMMLVGVILGGSR